MSRRVLILVGGVAAFWLLLALPALEFSGPDAVLQSGLAALLCVVPAVVVLVWADWAFAQNAEHQTYALLGGGGVRMFFVLGAALILTEVIGLYKGQLGFLLWLMVFYFFTLALEIGLLVTARQKANR